MGATLGGACSRRRRPEAEETPFWEEAPLSKARADDEEDERGVSLGYEQAVHLKDEGNEKFQRGGAEEEAIECWVHALDALGSRAAEQSLDGADNGEREGEAEDPRTQELRATLLLNIALGHRRLKQWRQAVSCCDEVLLEQPANVKALYRKADALGELCAWQEAEAAAAKLEEASEEGKKLAQQKREEWRRRRKVADGKQKKMWSAALSEPSPKKAAKEEQVEKPSTKTVVEERWSVPRVQQMSVFDLRVKSIQWDEKDDFSDELWRDSLGKREVTYYQKRALPLSLLAGVALADMKLQSDLVVHCLLDGNCAPFAQPHDWSVLLQACPSTRSLTVVYIDIGSVPAPSEEAMLPMPYGTLMRPTEEGRLGDRVARAARFLGTYREFKEHCKDLPGLVHSHLAIWADVPLYGFNDDDFATRMEVFELLAAEGVPCIVTQSCEIPAQGGPPMERRVDEHAGLSMAILSAGLGMKMVMEWQWNRFVVPLGKGMHGILAAHALLGVAKPPSGSIKSGAAAVKDALRKCGVTLQPYALPNLPPPPEEEMGKMREFQQMRKKQWEAFCRKLKEAGRPVGPFVSEEERHRQSMEFYQFCGMTDAPPN